MRAVLEVEALRKVFGRGRRRVPAVDGVDLCVDGATVFGLLGPNGSGKTTTLRCIVGLARPTSGRCVVRGRVGAVIDGQGLFPGFSGRRNLELLAALGRVDRRRGVDDVLARVGLVDRAADRVGTYSLGMRRRLGLAAALLCDPEVLVLDEPTNGLDPEGVRDVRELLRDLADEGRTVVVSSHALAEVQLSCDAVAVLSRGRCVASGTVSEVVAAAGGSELLVRVAPGEVSTAIARLTAVGFTARHEGDTLRVEAPLTSAGAVNECLARAGVYASELRPAQATLEDAYLRLVAT